MMSLIFSIGQKLCATLRLQHNSSFDLKFNENSFIAFLNLWPPIAMNENF